MLAKARAAATAKEAARLASAAREFRLGALPGLIAKEAVRLHLANAFPRSEWFNTLSAMCEELMRAELDALQPAVSQE